MRGAGGRAPGNKREWKAIDALLQEAKPRQRTNRGIRSFLPSHEATDTGHKHNLYQIVSSISRRAHN